VSGVADTADSAFGGLVCHHTQAAAKKATLPNLKPTTKTISLWLLQHVLDSLKVAANARDVPYQSLIKVWLREKLHSQ
jgi:predicted DNA binding CopG/RHH family protein